MTSSTPGRSGPLLAVLTLVVLVLAACGSGSGSSAAGLTDPEAALAPAGAAAEQGGGLVVMAELAPLADLVGQVLGDRGTAHSLIPGGDDAHTHEPRPSDVRQVTGADAFFGIGLGLNPAVLRLVEEHLPEGAPVVLLAETALAEDDLAVGAFGHTHGDGGSHSHGDAGGHSHGDEASRPAPNPHVWADPTNAMAMVAGIRDELVTIDPDGGEVYRDNARDLLQRIGALDEAIATATATIPAGTRTLVVYHDAWVYFGARYELEVVAAIQPADLSEPSARDVRRIIDQIRAEGVPKVFGSTEFPSDVLQTIAAETGAEHGAELSDDELPGEPGDPEHSYIGMMQRNARAIVTGLGGDPSAIDAVSPGGLR